MTNQERIRELKHLQRVYGDNMPLSFIVDKLLCGRIYECPNCNTTGKEMKEIRIPYPLGYPDSGWVPDRIEHKQVDCSLCNGYGYNNKEYKPKMVQNGWE